MGFLAIFYVVGLVGISLTPDFGKLTPFMLLLTAAVMLWVHPEKYPLFYVNLLLVFIASFLLEMTGVQSGIIFGAYHYGDALGPKFNGTPLMIGLNWVIVTYASVHIMEMVGRTMKKPIAPMFAALGAALLMVFLDALIEPLCAKLDFWYWDLGAPPVQNFTAWFFFGFAFCYWLIQSGTVKNNPMALRVYGLMAGFFLLLNFLLP